MMKRLIPRHEKLRRAQHKAEDQLAGARRQLKRRLKLLLDAEALVALRRRELDAQHAIVAQRQHRADQAAARVAATGEDRLNRFGSAAPEPGQRGPVTARAVPEAEAEQNRQGPLTRRAPRDDPGSGPGQALSPEGRGEGMKFRAEAGPSSSRGGRREGVAQDAVSLRATAGDLLPASVQLAEG